MAGDSEPQDAPLPSRSDRVLQVLFAAPFLSLIILAVLIWAGLDYYRQLDQKTWIEVPATVTGLNQHHDAKHEYLDVSYTYTIANQVHRGKYTFEVHEFDFDATRIPELETAYAAMLKQADAAVCSVKPNHPDRSVLERAGFTRWTAAKLVFAFVLLCLWVVMVREAGKEECVEVRAHINLPAFVPKEPQVLYQITPPPLNAPLSDTRASLITLLPMLLIGEYNSSLPRWWVALVMGSVLTLVLATLIFPGWRARRRNPASTLELDAAPIAAGEYFHGHLKVDYPVPNGTPFRIILRPPFWR